MFSSIRLRLTFSYLTVIILAMGLSGFLLLSFLERYFLQATEDSLVAQAHIAAQSLIPGSVTKLPTGEVPQAQGNLISAYNTLQQRQVGNLALQTENVPPVESPPPGDMDLSYLSDASLQFSAQLETRIRILDTNGSILLDSRPTAQESNLTDNPLIAQALSGQYATKTERGGEGMMILAMPALLEERVVGVVYLTQPLDDVTAVLRDLRSRWLLATIISLLLSGVVGLLLSGAIAKPLRRLTMAAGAVAQGQFDQQVPVRSKDELGRLSRTFNDMTSRLRAARQMQTDFVANVSHELRTPLTAIKGLVETLRNGAVDDLDVRDDFLETVEDETDRLTRLVNDLLTLSRVDSEALNLRRESKDLAPLIQTIVDCLSPLAEAKNLALSVDVAPNMPPVWIDSDRIEQVLLNLVDNAIKYSRPSGRVMVSVISKSPAHSSEGGEGDQTPLSEEPEEAVSHSILVQVRDEGIGIPTEELPRIGQRFYRSDKARSRTEGGSGLGLAIARALVQAHGGRLWVKSQEGAGTVVSFTLPQA